MFTSDLDFTYPPELIALEPSRPSRIAFIAAGEHEELTMPDLLSRFAPGDLLVVNESKVIPARVFSLEEVEVLFLNSIDESHWQVLFPSRDLKIGDQLNMPDGLTLTLVTKGLPQVVEVSRPLNEGYLQNFGEVALPPYIQEARGERHNRPADRNWYQTAWARTSGSVAAPTASLHFRQTHLDLLRENGVGVQHVTLHVGAGTFLPVKTSELSQHTMHAELASVTQATLEAIDATKARGGRVWALGTTVARTLESQANGMLHQQDDGSFSGPTKLFIYPPYEFKVVDALLTNFHQPKSTLFGLVAAFATLEKTKNVYAWAIERRFQLFSYGDLSAWIKP